MIGKEKFVIWLQYKKVYLVLKHIILLNLKLWAQFHRCRKYCLTIFCLAKMSRIPVTDTTRDLVFWLVSNTFLCYLLCSSMKVGHYHRVQHHTAGVPAFSYLHLNTVAKHYTLWLVACFWLLTRNIELFRDHAFLRNQGHTRTVDLHFLTIYSL